MDTDDVDIKRPTSYLWLIIILVIAVLLCIFLKPSETSSEQSIPPKDVEKPQSWDCYPVTQDPKPSLYETLDSNIDAAIAQLKRKAQQAKRIIPYFPDFPELWLIPPVNKGSYGSLGERYSVEFLELLFPNYRFVKAKHKWMKSRKNYPLELDGFCEELMIAVEYNGYQHYVWPNHYHKTIEEFNDQRERDQIKLEACIERNICLIRIPYTVKPIDRIPLAVYAKLLEAVPGLI